MRKAIEPVIMREILIFFLYPAFKRRETIGLSLRFSFRLQRNKQPSTPCCICYMIAIERVMKPIVTPVRITFMMKKKSPSF